MKLRLRAALLPLCACVVLGALASPALAAAPRTFVPRVGNALGLIPPVNSQGNFNTEPTETGVFTPVVYHGGPTMNQGVAVHTIFWAPSAFPFQGAPDGFAQLRGDDRAVLHRRRGCEYGHLRWHVHDEFLR